MSAGARNSSFYCLLSSVVVIQLELQFEGKSILSNGLERHVSARPWVQRICLKIFSVENDFSVGFSAGSESESFRAPAVNRKG